MSDFEINFFLKNVFNTTFPVNIENKDKKRLFLKYTYKSI